MIARWNTPATGAVLIALPVMLASAPLADLWPLTLIMAFVVVQNAVKLHVVSPWRERHAQ